MIMSKEKYLRDEPTLASGRGVAETPTSGADRLHDPQAHIDHWRFVGRDAEIRDELGNLIVERTFKSSNSRQGILPSKEVVSLFISVWIFSRHLRHVRSDAWQLHDLHGTFG